MEVASNKPKEAHKKGVVSTSVQTVIRKLAKSWQLYAIISPVIVYMLIFEYYPMYGLQIAFKDFYANKGIWGSPWVGFKHFEQFFDSYYFWRVIRNTVLISAYSLAISFPVPIILALLIHEVRWKPFRKFVQTVTYAPHFLSTVVVVGMIYMFLHPDRGLVNQFIQFLGFEPITFMESPAWFKSLYVFSGTWQTMGWSSIIYLAALASVDPQLHEAAKVDGANRFKRMWHINVPGIMPTAIIILILSVGTLLNVGFEKIYLMQNLVNKPASDVISTYVYQNGILEGKYSFSAAVGLFNSVINFILLIMLNAFARRVSETSLW